jgi:uncharacterized membrane protein (DUF106 family)
MASFLDPILNPLLQPLLDTSPFWAVVLLAFVVSLLITLVYKYMTNQDEMKRLKGQQKDFQKSMKELRDKPEEMMKVQKDAMKVNMEYMKHSFKPTLITMIPIILLFGWMTAHLSYEPIYPGERFSVTANFADGVVGEAQLLVDDGMEILSEKKLTITDGKVNWNLKSSSGNHFMTVKIGNDEQSKKILITQNLIYEDPLSEFEHSDISSININYNKLKPLGNTSLFGWKPGWLGIYIILSIVFSMGMRKGMKLH